MNKYPKLNADEYDSTGAAKREAVINMMAEAAVDVWRYYVGQSLSSKEQEAVYAALNKVLPK